MTYRPAEDGVLVVAVSGELDIATAPLLERALCALHQGTNVRVDLAAVSFVDAGALAVLVAAHARSRAAGGYFELTRVTPFVRKIVALVGLEYLLEADRVEAPRLTSRARELPRSRSKARPTGDGVR